MANAITNLFVSPSPSDKVLAEQARILHRQIPQSVIGGAGVALFLFVLAFQEIPISVTVPWALVYLAVNGYRLYVYKEIKPHFDDDAALLRWERKMHKVLFLAGSVWGITVFGLILQFSTVTDAVLVTLMGGLSAGAVSAIGVIHRCYIMYTMPMLLPLTLALLLGGSNIGYGLAAMVVLFVFANLSFSKNICLANLDTITTKMKNDELITQMENQQQILEQQNHEIQNSMRLADEANKAKSVFLASASHDLAQPLHSMRLFLMALENEEDAVVRAELIDKARQCSDGLSDLFMALLDISKLDADVVVEEPTVFDVAEVMDSLAIEFSELAKDKNIAFESHITSSVVQTDATILQRVLRNLLHNALKYTRDGSIALGSKVNGNSVVITVTDSGPGIPEEEFENIFNEFYQIGNPERDRTRGLGLGLAIVKRLSELANYQINVSSTLGVGTTITLTMPVSDLITDTRRANTTSVKETSDTKRHVAFIDDEEDTRIGMAQVLKGMGFEATVGESYEDILHQLISSEVVPDLIISDYRLRHHQTGVDAIRQLRDEFNEDVPALIITGDTSAESLRDIGENNIDVTHKLSSQAVLNAKINELLHGARHKPEIP